MAIKNWRSAALGFIALCLCVLSIGEGVIVGATKTLPGALARHTSALAVSISCLAYGHCTGFQSYREVDKVLYDEGLNYAAVEATAGQIYRDHELIDRAISKAARLTNPGTELVSMGPHEKGLSIFYLISLAVFGMKLSSLFYGFMLLFCISVATFMATFYRDLIAMTFLVGACCAMLLIVPVVQNIDLDVNSVHGSRFIPLLAIIPTMHILLLIERKPKRLRVAPALVEAAILFLIIFARLSGAWMIGGIALWIAVRAFYPGFLRAILLPAGLTASVMAALVISPMIALDHSYLDRDQTEYRTFWHHLLVAANHNPQHAEITGLPVYDDLVAYRLFEQEVARRGENIYSYLIDDARDWQLRTTDRKYDYKWGLYESVVKTVFLRQLSDHPFYVASSFLIYEPIAIVKQMTVGYFLPPTAPILIAGLFAALSGIILSGARERFPRPIFAIGSLFSAMSLLPAEASGVMPLRLAEPAFLLYAFASIAFAFAIKAVGQWILYRRPVHDGEGVHFTGVESHGGTTVAADSYIV